MTKMEVDNKQDYTILISFSSTHSILNIIDSLCDLTSKVNLEVNSCGLQLNSFNTSKTILCDLNYTKESFIQFQLENERPIVLGLDLQVLKNALKCNDTTKTGNITTISYTSKNPDLYELVTITKHNITIKHKLRLLDIETEFLQVKFIEHHISVSYDVRILLEILSKLTKNKIINYTFIVTLDNDKLKMKICGDDANSHTIQLPGDNWKINDDITEDEDEQFSYFAKFNMNLMKQVLKFGKSVPKMDLYFGTDKPMQAVIPLESGSTLLIYLASNSE